LSGISEVFTISMHSAGFGVLPAP